MNSKTSYTLCSSSSDTSYEKSTSVIIDASIVQRLYLAQQKLRPVIDDLLKTDALKSVNGSHYLTVEQYEDAVSASLVLKEVGKILSEKQYGKFAKKSYNLNKFKLEREDVKVNKLGKIFVDTSILIQLIELHKSLGDIITNAQEICTDVNFSNDACSSTQTNLSNSSQQNESCEGRNLSLDESFNATVKNKNPENVKPKIKINLLNKNNLKERLIKGTILQKNAYPLQENIVVMYTEEGLDNTKKLPTLSEERTSNSESNIVDDRPPSRKIKSTGSIKSDSTDYKVTDVVGARKIILNCLHDLKKVGSFLETIDVDVSAGVQIQSAVVDNTKPEKARSAPQVEEKKNIKRNPDHPVPMVDESESSKKMRPTNEHKEGKEGSSERHVTQINFKDVKGECPCGPTYVSDTPMELLLDAGDDNASKLIICIKGKSEEDGDVQIIIRQCSECKNLGGTDDHSDIIEKNSKEQNKFPSTSSTRVKEKHSSQSKEHTREESSDINLLINPNDNSMFDQPAEEVHIDDMDYQHTPSLVGSSEVLEQEKPKLNVLFDPDHPSQTVVEPSTTISSEEKSVESEKKIDIHQDTSHHISHEDDMLPNESDQEKPGINVIFDPDNPSQSIVEPPKKTVSVKDHKEKFVEEIVSPKKVPLHKKTSKKSSETDDGCSKVKLYETTNLCFSTDDGQELIISLTIRPKTGPLPKISLNDIFSDSTTDAEKTFSQTQKHIANIFASEPKIAMELQDTQECDYFIPLSRTKVCSSLDFDVSVMETRMQSRGIKHVNQGIVVRLKEMGVNNLLRACRPVKCGRPSVLNEKLRKSLPYTASLTSLPLEENDTHIIDQSLDMSFNKTKYSSVKNKKKQLAYFTQLRNITDNINFAKNLQIHFSCIQRSIKFNLKSQISLNNYYVRKKLSYYINLIHDVETEYTKHIYLVNFFEVKKLHLQSTNNMRTTKVNNDLIQSAKEDSQPSAILKRESVLKMFHRKEVPVEYQNDIHVISNTSKMKHKNNEENLKLRKHDCRKENKKFVSKIPIYKCSRKKDCTSKDKLNSDSYIYNISLQSLPKEEANEKKDLKVIRNNGQKLDSTIQRIEWEEHKKLQNKVCSNDRNNTEKNIKNNSEIYRSSKISNDSLELYFNNFFRDKYFSKLALCQKQSSNRSLKPRKKKSEYHCSRSHSQTCFSDSKLDIRSLSNNSLNPTRSSEKMCILDNRIFSENNFRKPKDKLKGSLSVTYYFSKIFSEHLAKDTFLSETDSVHKKLASLKSSASFGNMLMSDEFQNFFLNLKERIIEENSYSVSIFPSQPNVEAGMDKEDDEITFVRGLSKQNSIYYPSIDGNFNVHQRFMPKEDKIMNNSHNEIRCDSCDNFKNMIVKFESNMSLNELSRLVSPQNGYVQPLKASLPSKGWTVTENTGHIIEKIIDGSLEHMDIEPLSYLVYLHYFNTQTLLKKVIEKSKNLFKSNCNKNGMEYANEKSLFSLKECKICGCNIENCKSSSPVKTCFCPKPKISTKEDTVLQSRMERRKTRLKETSQNQYTPKRSHTNNMRICRNKKSIGTYCFPKNADICTSAQLGDKAIQTFSKKCYCIKCEKRSVDGSCYCSHCLGIFDKSVGIKPFNKEIATQCTCYKSKNIDTTKNMLNKSENEQVDITDINNISNIEPTNSSPVLDIKQIPNNSDAAVISDIKNSSELEEPIKTNTQNELKFEENNYDTHK